MKATLDQFVDDYIEYVLAVIDAMQAGEEVAHVGLHESLSQRIEMARQSHHHDDNWESAMYGLVALTDELLLEMPWSGRIWWNDHVLEATVFRSRVCSERFYQLAEEVARETNVGGIESQHSTAGVLRVFHDCVLLGFRGVYSMPGLSLATTKELRIPPTLEDWLAKTQRQLDDNAVVNEPARQHRLLGGAIPNATRRSIVWWAVAAGVMLIANVAIFSLTDRS